MNAEDTVSGFSPPYSSFKTSMNLWDRMAQEGIPSRVDRSYLSNLPGSTQTMVLGSMRSLGLIDASSQPTPTLIEITQADDENRRALVGHLLQHHYAAPLALGTNATQQQLEEAFRQYGVTGSTLRKAVAFFLAAAKYAEVPISPHFRTPRAQRNGVARRPTKRTAVAEEAKVDPPAGFNPLVKPEPPDLHPFLQGLLQELPTGGSWTKTKRDTWLEIATHTVDMLYRVDDEPAPKPAPTTGQGGEEP